MAQEPARQQRRRRDHRPTTASTPTATGRRSGTTTWRARPTTSAARPTTAPSAQSEPEVSALARCISGSSRSSCIDYHSFAPLILYPEGWQVETAGDRRAADEGARRPTTTTRRSPGFDPDVSAELYTTNGDVTGDAYNNYGTQAYTVELDGGTGAGVGGTVDGPDSFRPAASSSRTPRPPSRRSSRRTCTFALDLARRRPTRTSPESHLGNTAPDFVPTHVHDLATATRRPSRSTPSARSAPCEVVWQVNGGARAARRPRRVRGRRALRHARHLLPQAARPGHRVHAGRHA